MTDKTKAELEALIASIDDILALIGRNSLLASTAETLKSKRAEAQAALAAKEVVDPLLMEAREICARVCEGWRDIPSERAHAYRCGSHDDEADVAYVLAALRRGMELASAPAEPVDEATFMDAVWEALKSDANDLRKQQRILAAFRATLAHRGARWPGDGRCKVPVGQTPLDDNLHHRLLDVIKEGQQCRDDGTGSPYHGRSLEHCLHATGWVQRDLRLALDKANEALAHRGARWPGADVLRGMARECAALGYERIGEKRNAQQVRFGEFDDGIFPQLALEAMQFAIYYMKHGDVPPTCQQSPEKDV
jgi:hypothetical protein